MTIFILIWTICRMAFDRWAHFGLTKTQFFYYLINSFSKKQAKVYLLTYSAPWLSLFGMVSNLLVVLTILNAYRPSLHKNSSNAVSAAAKQVQMQMKQIKQQAFFTYMLFNSALNTIYCFIYIIDYLYVCVPKKIDEKYTTNNCVIKDFWVSTAASVLKLMANFTFIQMSLSRYILVGKGHAEWLVKFAKTEKLKFMCTSFVLSLVLSAIVVYQVQFFSDQSSLDNSLVFNEDYLFRRYEDYEDRASNQDIFLVLTQKIHDQLPFVFGLIIVHDLFSYFLFCLCNSLIEIMTIIKHNQDVWRIFAEHLNITEYSTHVQDIRRTWLNVREKITMKVRSSIWFSLAGVPICSKY
jgi:hypothetical protein